MALSKPVTNREVQAIARQVKDHFVGRYGDAVEGVLLYGSYALGQGREESDIDLLVVVREPLEPEKVRRDLDDLLLDILLEQSEPVSVLVVSRQFYETSASPFIKQVRKEAS